jgi:hypothetical protein
MKLFLPLDLRPVKPVIPRPKELNAGIAKGNPVFGNVPPLVLELDDTGV